MVICSDHALACYGYAVMKHEFDKRIAFLSLLTKKAQKGTEKAHVHGVAC